MKRNPELARLMTQGLMRLVETVLLVDEPLFQGLDGVVAGESQIASVGDELTYRGYPIEDLAERASFLEVAWLLLHGELPTQEFLADFRSIVLEPSTLPGPVLELLDSIPLHVGSMDVLRTAVSAISHYDPQLDDDSREGMLAKGTSLLTLIPQLIAARHRFSQGLEVLEPNPELSFGGNLLWLITGELPTAEEEKAMEASLILYAEHDVSASTLTARVVTSTCSDLYSAVTAAVGALKGPLHGGANEQVMDVLGAAGAAGSIEGWVRTALAEGRRIMGFGHRVYKTGDPRVKILNTYCRQLADAGGNEHLESTANAVEGVMAEEKGLYPNLEWPSARLFHYLGLDRELYTPLSAAARTVGWCAHIIEQAENNRLIRPRSKYTGPKRREFIPVAQRG